MKNDMIHLPHPDYNGDISTVTMQDGTTLRTASWGSDANSRAIIILVQGRGEFVEKYSEFISDLLDRNFAVYSFDHRGQGLSERALTDRSKSYIKNFDDYSNDLNEFISNKVLFDARAHELPLYLIGHSMGAHICLRYLHDFPDIITKAILMAPMVKFIIGNPCKDRILKPLIRLANGLGFGKYYAPGQKMDLSQKRQLSKQQTLTHDFERYQQEDKILESCPDLFVGGVTFGWLNSALDSIIKIRTPHYLDIISIPIRVILAGEDTVVENSASIELFSGHETIDIVTIQRAYHEIYRESDFYRDQLLQEIDDFFVGL